MSLPRSLRQILRRQAEDYVRLTDSETLRMIRAFEDARRELQARLEESVLRLGGDAFTPHQIRGTLLQVELGIRGMQSRLTNVLDLGVERARGATLKNLVEVLARHDANYAGAQGAIDIAITRRLAAPDSLLLHHHSIERYGREAVNKMQATLTQSAIQRRTIRQTREALVGARGSVLASMRPRANLIARMELGSAANREHEAGIEEAAEVLPDPKGDPLLKRISEFFEPKRNHPISLVLDGMTTTPKGSFTAKVSAVQAAGDRIGKGTGGVVWPLNASGTAYVGKVLPAHFNDRGTIHAWRASWAE